MHKFLLSSVSVIAISLGASNQAIASTDALWAGPYVDGSFKATDLHSDTPLTTTGRLNSFGGVVGGGVEARVADNITMGIEALYYIFNKKNTSLAAFSGGGTRRPGRP